MRSGESLESEAISWLPTVTLARLNWFQQKLPEHLLLSKWRLQLNRTDVKKIIQGPLKKLTPNNCSWLWWMPFNNEMIDEIWVLAGIFVIFRYYIVNFSRNVSWNQFPLSMLRSSTGRNNRSFTMIINLIVVVHPRSKNHWTVLLIIRPQIKVCFAMSCVRAGFNTRNISCIFD